MRIALDEAIAATGARACNLQPHAPPLRIVTDTRSLAPGDTFLALRGERFDGHRFAADALTFGAACAIVEDAGALPPGAPGLVVDDTLRAYMALAARARDALSIPVIAVTGSTGKTTTKHLLADLLAGAGLRVAATPQNENNEIGVSKFFLAREADEDDVAIVEMGARHYGDIAVLVSIARPTLGILTNVGEAHLEIMGTRERLAETKWAIFDENASPVLNLDDAISRERAVSLDRAPRWFAAGSPDVPPDACATIVRDAHTCIIIDRGRERTIAIDAHLPGEYNRANLAAALAAARTLVPIEALAPLIAVLSLPSGRYERRERDGIVVVYDAYNASASGTRATLAAFAEERAQRRIVVFGGMAELGDDAAALHEAIGEAVASLEGAVMLTGGEFAQATVRGARSAGMTGERIVEYGTNGEAAAWLREHARAGDAILLKGSRRYRMEEIAEALEGVRVS